MIKHIHKRLNDEDGFTLIELLVVVIIIGILAAIAIPTFLSQRENGWTAAAESDARNAALVVESLATTNNGNYPADADITEADDFENSPDVTLAYTVDLTAGAQAFCVAATHANLDAADAPHAVYDSGTGGLSDACTSV